jgi:hypothetical protein
MNPLYSCPRRCSLAGCSCCSLCLPVSPVPRPQRCSPTRTNPYGQLPLHFEKNRGQTHDESQSGLGEGDMTPDWVVSGHTLRLRAERASDGTRRIYTVTYTFADGPGSSSPVDATVTVPSNR